MPITQIPFKDPVPAPPPAKPEPEQLDLYDTHDWEQAYRELDARVPHLLIQLEDDLARSRRREAAWMSIIAHLLLFICLWNLPLIQKTLGIHRAFVVPVNPMQDKNVTFLPLPPDLQKPTHKPNTNVMSDKDRIAMSRRPQIDPNELKKILTPPPGAPGLTGPRAAQPAPSVQPAPQGQPSVPPQQQAAPAQRPQIQSNQTAQLQAPARPNNSFSKYAAPMTAGSAIQQATQAAATNRGGGGQAGDFGLGTGQKGRKLGQLEILSDTQGVDFAPYLQRILEVVRQQWYVLIPESAEMKKGKLAIEFVINKDGSVAQMHLDSSGDVSLDRPAWGSITGSTPFPPLPREFNGPYLALRFRYYYNPDKADLE